MTFIGPFQLKQFYDSMILLSQASGIALALGNYLFARRKSDVIYKNYMHISKVLQSSDFFLNWKMLIAEVKAERQKRPIVETASTSRLHPDLVLSRSRSWDVTPA